MENESLDSVDTLVSKHPGIAKGTVKRWLFDRNSNGLAESGALIKFGRRIFIKESKFLEWMESHNTVTGG